MAGSLNLGAAPQPAPAADAVINGTTATFMRDVIEASMKQPVVVDFWATWCGPCKTLGPVIERAVREAKGAVRLVKIDVDRNQELAAQMRIQSIPAVYAFSGGRPVDGFVGSIPESQVREFVKRLTTGAKPDAGGGIDEAIAEAKAMLAEGDAKSALEVFQEILAAERGNVAATAGALRALIALSEAQKARKMLDALAPELAANAEIAAVRAALELAEQGSKAGSTAQLEAKVAADAGDFQSRLDLATALFAAGRREEAVDHLLEIVRRNRAWNEEAARKQLVKLFEAMGPTDPLTVASRKRLSSLLFA